MPAILSNEGVHRHSRQDGTCVVDRCSPRMARCDVARQAIRYIVKTGWENITWRRLQRRRAFSIRHIADDALSDAAHTIEDASDAAARHALALMCSASVRQAVYGVAPGGRVRARNPPGRTGGVGWQQCGQSWLSARHTASRACEVGRQWESGFVGRHSLGSKQAWIPL